MNRMVLKPLAAAVTLALASVSAHAALTAPIQTLTSVPNPTGLYLAVYDASGNNSEVVNLTVRPVGDHAGLGRPDPEFRHGAVRDHRRASWDPQVLTELRPNQRLLRLQRSL